MRHSLSGTVAGIAALACGAACHSSTGPHFTGPATIELESAGPNSAMIGSSITPLPSFVVRDSGNRALPNVTVQLVATLGSHVTPSTVTTDANGRATPASWILGTRAGNAALVAIVPQGALSATAVVVASPGPPTALAMTPGSVAMELADTVTLSAVATDSYKNPITAAPITFGSSDSAVVAVSGNKLIARGAGSATITGTITGTTISSTASVTVLDRFGHFIGRAFGIGFRDGQPGSYLVTLLDVNQLSIVNASTYGASASVAVSQTPTDVAVDPSAALAYVTAADGSNIAVVNLGSSTKQRDIGDFSSARLLLSPDANQLYVGRAGALDVISSATGTRVASLSFSGQVNGLALSPDGSTLWASDRFGGSVYRISTATLAITDSINTGGAPQEVIFDSGSGNVYVANESGWIDVLEATHLAIVSRFSGIAGAFGMRLTPDGSKLFVSGSSAGVVYLVDRSTGAVLKTTNVGGTPRRIVVLPDGRAAVANERGWVDFVH